MQFVLQNLVWWRSEKLLIAGYAAIFDSASLMYIVQELKSLLHLVIAVLEKECLAP
jgi:hypothetical protein